MSGGARRAAWWAGVIVLTAGVLTALGIGLWQAIEARQLEQTDDTATRQTVLDHAKSTAESLLSYTPENAETQLTGSLSLLTGDFRSQYAKLIGETVIPAAREKQVSADAQIPAAGIESLSRDRAEVIVFINQKVTTGTEAPTETASSVRMGLVQVDGKWLVDKFEPL